jgi:hypothetical protein
MTRPDLTGHREWAIPQLSPQIPRPGCHRARLPLRAFNPRVVGSIPTGPTLLTSTFVLSGVRNSLHSSTLTPDTPGSDWSRPVQRRGECSSGTAGASRRGMRSPEDSPFRIAVVTQQRCL